MRNFTIGRLWGIPIRLHASLVLLLPFLAYLLGSGEQIGADVGLINGLWPGFDRDRAVAGPPAPNRWYFFPTTFTGTSAAV